MGDGTAAASRLTGVPVTLDSDDSRVSDVTLSHEHDVALTRVGLDAAQVRRTARRSATAAFRS